MTAHRALSRYAPGDDGSALVRQHHALIDKCARQLAAKCGQWDAFDDFWTAGALGLVDAWNRFRPEQDVRFETFAEHRVRGAMLDELRRMDHLPRRLRSKASAVEKQRKRLADQLHRDPSAAEIAEEMKLALDEVEAILAVATAPLPVESGREEAVVDAAMVSHPQAEHVLARKDRARDLAGAIAALPDRLQLVLALKYDEGFTYREIGEILEVSEPRVSQLHTEALAKLRAILDVDVLRVL